MLIYGKKDFKFFISGWKTLVFSLGDSGPTRFVQMISLGWPWPVLLHQRPMVDFKINWQQCLWGDPLLNHYGLLEKWPTGDRALFAYFSSGEHIVFLCKWANYPLLSSVASSSVFLPICLQFLKTTIPFKSLNGFLSNLTEMICGCSFKVVERIYSLLWLP